MKTISELRAEAKVLQPIVRIGKAGFKDSVIEEVKKHLKQKGLIKVKMLKSFVASGDKKLLAREIADKTDSILVQRVGFVAVLARK